MSRARHAASPAAPKPLDPDELARFAARVGVTLEPWQRAVVEGLADGSRTVWGPRRPGKSGFLQLVLGLELVRTGHALVTTADQGEATRWCADLTRLLGTTVAYRRLTDLVVLLHVGEAP